MATTILTLGVALGQAWGQELTDVPHSDPGLLTLSPIFATVLSQSHLSKKNYRAHVREFTLRDGTKLGGLLFLRSKDEASSLPLIIADFGLMSSRWSALGEGIIRSLLEKGKLDANLLVVDDLSGAGFFSLNQSLSIGGYDAGRILNLLADELPAQGISYSSLHLLGESLGGQAVLQAVVEDFRLGTHHFQSAMIVSGVVDEIRSTANVFESFGKTLQGFPVRGLPKLGKLFLDVSTHSFRNDLKARHVSDLPRKGQEGEFFYDHFQERLRLPTPPDWNPEVSRESVESYLKTSSVLLTYLPQTGIPILAIHAKDDPVVDFDQFGEFAQVHRNDPNILTLATRFGSHCGFLATYGRDWFATLIQRSLHP
jgi:predicted alpha/beta-fold hydrolase